MVAHQPLSTLALAASSVADDLGFIALADLSEVLTGGAVECRVIGGHMVTVLAARWRLGAELIRETGDADLGLPPIAARDYRIVERLKRLGYDQIAGNRFARPVTGIPVRLLGVQEYERQAIIDVLIPAYTSRARQNVKVGNDLITTEVPGLAGALGRPAVMMTLELRRLSAESLVAKLPFPDEVSALKSLATQVRSKATDIADVWRCLEIGFAAGLGPADFAGTMRAEAVTQVRTLFARSHGPGMTALIDEQHLTREAADQRFTRIRALIARVIGPG
jgi:hypothetical protein